MYGQILFPLGNFYYYRTVLLNWIDFISQKLTTYFDSIANLKLLGILRRSGLRPCESNIKTFFRIHYETMASAVTTLTLTLLIVVSSYTFEKNVDNVSGYLFQNFFIRRLVECAQRKYRSKADITFCGINTGLDRILQWQDKCNIIQKYTWFK